MAPANKVIEINASEGQISSVLFTEDDKQVLSGGSEGVLRRWQVDDGHETGEPILVGNAQVYAMALSPDRKWLVCGLNVGDRACAGLWNAQTREKVQDVTGTEVCSVDVSPDSTRFTTGGLDKQVFVWSLPDGKKLLGPLMHGNWVQAVQFSLNGDRIATATYAQSIRIFASDDGKQLLDIPFNFEHIPSTPLAWSTDGCQIFAVSPSEVKCFDTSSKSLISQWFLPRCDGNSYHASIVLSGNARFATVSTRKSLSFWDISTRKQIGSTIKQASIIYSIALSANNDHIAIGEGNGKVTLHSLRGILPDSYLAVNVSIPTCLLLILTVLCLLFAPSPPSCQLPFISIECATFDLWKQGDLTHVEEHLTDQIADPSCSARTLAQRALVRGRLGQWDMALADAEKSIETERSVVGYVALANFYASQGEYETTSDIFDFVFRHSIPSENDALLLTKAIILFQCGKHENAISRLDRLIHVADDQLLCTAVQAHMFLLFAGILIGQGSVERSVVLLQRALNATQFHSAPFLTLVSLFFGWDFDKLDVAIRARLQECIKPIEDLGDAAVRAERPEEALQHYSTALSLDPPNPAGVLIKRSRAYASVNLWDKSLTDADAAIEADPESPWAYEARYVALCGQGRIDDAFDAFTRMFSFVEGSTDQDVRQLAKKYIPLSRSMNGIDEAIGVVSRTLPLVLIDVKSGCLCDDRRRRATFKSEPEFRELMSSMMLETDDDRIQQVVERYFEYVTLSHVWEGMEPLLQDVDAASTVMELDSTSPLNVKLQRFCNVVRADGYRWAWSDTCCIDKTISTVLNQSLKMMYLWYEFSAATFVFLTDVELLSDLLKNSKWLTRAWTSQELLSPKVVRFYTRDWKPYRGDVRPNHKESPEIMQELAEAIGIASETIVSFHPDDFSVRQKLRLASTRNATREEDVAYSLIGIFKSDIRPDYGEGYAALGHLLEEVVSRSGEVTVLDWTGKSSQYNSCLPDSLAVYSRPPGTSPTIEDAEMNAHIASLRNSVPQADAIQFHVQITLLPPARFLNRRLNLPCLIFTVRKLGLQNFGDGGMFCYRARVSGIGELEFRTSDKLSPDEPRKLILVHPWIRDLCDPPLGFSWGSSTDEEENSDTGDESAPSSPLHGVSSPPVDAYTQALRLVARLRQSFHGLLLQQQSGGEFRRVAAEHEIVVPGIRQKVNLSKDIRTAVVEIL